MSLKRGSIEEVREFWNARPCNIRHSTAPLGTLEFFQQVSDKKFKVESHKLTFLNLESVKGKRVLELGCGMGTDAVKFAEAGASVVCVDLTPAAIDLCKQNFAARGLSAEFYCGNIEELDTFLPKDYLSSFDLVYSFGVIHHTPSPSRVIDQLRLFLKQGGEFRCMVYSRFSYKLFWLMNLHSQWSLTKSDEIIQQYSEAQSGCPVTYTFTSDEVKQLLGESFTVDRIWKDHIFKYDIPSYVKGGYDIDAAFTGWSEELFQQMERELGWHTLCIAHLN
jgi:2-polyprenyl-3-methyl-5-hydroxy-6-metoxy-1,4-benzoquinol methylase